MQIGSAAQALVARMSDVPRDPVAQVQAVAQVTVLRKAADVEADLVKTLIDGLGGTLDVRG